MRDNVANAFDPAKLVPSWYVLRTRSRHEKVVRDQLVQRDVENFLPIYERWSPVPDTEIAALERLTATTLQYDPHPFLEAGMEVEVIRGPLSGVRGRLLRKDRVTKLVLAVTLIRQAAIVEIHPGDVVKV